MHHLYNSYVKKQLHAVTVGGATKQKYQMLSGTLSTRDSQRVR